MVAVRSFGEAIDFLVKYKKLLLLTIIPALISGVASPFVEEYPETQRFSDIIIERYGAISPEINWKLYIPVVILVVTILSGIEFGIIDFAIKAKRGKVDKFSLKEIAIYGLRNAGWGLLLTIISSLYLLALVIGGSIPFIILLLVFDIVDFLEPLVPIVELLFVIWVLILTLFSLSVSGLVFPRFVDTRSLREALRVIKYGRRYKASMIGFGALLGLSSFALLMAVGIVEMSVYMFSMNTVARLLASLLTVPLIALLSLFVIIAETIFYENVRADYEERRALFYTLYSNLTNLEDVQ
ncbi:hypothetical protein PFDSM3638_04265 [Pyrococcus furiosus DSM 3638]|uniref:Uncharacterized protein n=3 Tax=Pyrococcus furiosus TaxID=2261 RepID=Q8U2I0_PYRFU|nr:hypothetical protein [Pyrococcus furiosus]AAL80979.1 hypothetical protein PF0855 [Pyrococcus furiosus DSM 3638]AFN03643.1 hypothetical protein PFC_03470 [Pyrococcus furiosus COM1]QEK78527.1 hypothetical protein PFDSM3638_04265 [Pyrococcus furiosus DSM 3638]